MSKVLKDSSHVCTIQISLSTLTNAQSSVKLYLQAADSWDLPTFSLYPSTHTWRDTSSTEKIWSFFKQTSWRYSLLICLAHQEDITHHSRRHQIKQSCHKSDAWFFCWYYYCSAIQCDEVLVNFMKLNHAKLGPLSNLRNMVPTQKKIRSIPCM